MTPQTIFDFLHSHRQSRVLLAAHQRPDGDAIGSCFGLAHTLISLGYDVLVAEPNPVPSNLRFLLDDSRIAKATDGDWWSAFDCLGVLDCGEADRLDLPMQAAAAALPAFNIDHHVSSRGVGEAVWIDPQASSTGEMVVRLCRAAGWPLPPAAAQALWTAIVTDTGRFSFENATAAALEAGRECVAAGAEPAVVARHIYQSVGVPERRLQALILERMRFLENGRLATAWLREEDFAQAGVGVEGAQDMINLLRDTAGVEVSILFYETGNGVKASLRTVSPYDAVALVGRFGGGGHARAAGCSLPGPLDAARETIIECARALFFSGK